MELILEVIKGLWVNSGLAALSWQNCVMLLVSLSLFWRCQAYPADHAMRRLALVLLENPAGILLCALVCLALLLDHFGTEAK